MYGKTEIQANRSDTCNFVNVCVCVCVCVSVRVRVCTCMSVCAGMCDRENTGARECGYDRSLCLGTSGCTFVKCSAKLFWHFSQLSVCPASLHVSPSVIYGSPFNTLSFLSCFPLPLLTFSLSLSLPLSSCQDSPSGGARVMGKVQHVHQS